MSVPNESPVNTYTGNGTTTKFPVTFQFETQDTLVLKVDGSVAPISDYYWTSDSSFNFYTAPASGTVIEILRNTPKERDNDYDDNYNTFRPKTLNKDFDRIWRVIQEYLIKIDRNEQGLAQEILDRIQADADMLDYIMNQDNAIKQDYIQRDEALKNYIDQMIALVTGDPSFDGIDAQFVKDESGLNQQEINASLKLRYFSDLRNLKAAKDGQSVYVTQRNATYIHGGGFFKADKADTTTVDNDGTVLVGVDGIRWKRQWSTHADPCWFGADYTATNDCSAEVQKAVDVSTGRVWFGNASRNFKITGIVGLPTNSIVGDMIMEICGDGARIWVYSTTGIFTSQRSIGFETSTDDLYTACLEIGRGLRFQGDGTSPSVVINGDRLYNVNMKGGRYLRISALVKATQPRRNETTGYVQSVTIEGNHLALCTRIIDSKRGFNVNVSRNFGESCYGGVYLDGDGSPAVNVIRCDGNLWESSGVFAKLGAVYAGTFIGNYFEGNSAGDMPTMKCLIELGKVGTTGYSSGVTFIGNQFGAATAYKTDVDYADVKFNSSFSGTNLDVLAPPTFVGNWTNAYRMWIAGQVVTQFGNSFSTTAARQRHQAPKLHTEARVSFDLSRKEFLSSTYLVSGVHTICEIDTNLISNLASQSSRACSADLNIFMQMKNASNVVLGAAVAKVSLVVQGSEGIGTGATTDVYVGAALTGFTQLESGVIDTVNNVNLFKHFTNPALTIERVGTKYLLKLSGYTAASGSPYGVTSKVFSNTTMTIYSLNSGASVAGQIYPT